MPLSTFVAVFNILMFLVGLLVLGKVFALTTAISSFYYPAILAVFQSLFGEVRLTEDPLLATVLAGLMIGAGIGVVIRAGASTGGMDIPPLVLQKKLRIPVSVSLYVFDCLILLLQALFSNVEQVLYGLVMVLLYTLTLNKTLLLGAGQMQLKVVSKKYGEISQAIQRQVDRGTTLFQSMGGFEQDGLHRADGGGPPGAAQAHRAGDGNRPRRLYGGQPGQRGAGPRLHQPQALREARHLKQRKKPPPLARAGGSFVYPKAVSSTIMSRKPAMTPRVPALECSPKWASGMSSSTTT